MIFADFVGPADIYRATAVRLREQIAEVFRSTPDGVALRRVVTEGERQEVELWVELSTEEQLYRHGKALAERLSSAVRETSEVDVWVMFRIVPLSHAFLNGQPRTRGTPSFE